MTAPGTVPLHVGPIEIYTASENCELWDLHGGEILNRGLLGYDSVWDECVASTLKMEAVCSVETLATTYAASQATRPHTCNHFGSTNRISFPAAHSILKQKYITWSEHEFFWQQLLIFYFISPKKIICCYKNSGGVWTRKPPTTITMTRKQVSQHAYSESEAIKSRQSSRAYTVKTFRERTTETARHGTARDFHCERSLRRPSRLPV
jgi:hypothetical protein